MFWYKLSWEYHSANYIVNFISHQRVLIHMIQPRKISNTYHNR